MRSWLAMGIACCLLSGCAAAGLTVAGAGAGVGMATGVDHTLSGTVYKTFTAPINQVRLATLKTLDRMDMRLTRDERTDTGWLMGAAASQRSIEIELEQLTGNTSRMRVTADQGVPFFKDSATATEIVMQTAQTLEPQTTQKTQSSKPGARPTASVAPSDTQGRSAR